MDQKARPYQVNPEAPFENARACGFHRDVLYSYPNVIALLDAHDQAEHAASQRWLEKS